MPQSLRERAYRKGMTASISGNSSSSSPQLNSWPSTVHIARANDDGGLDMDSTSVSALERPFGADCSATCIACVGARYPPQRSRKKVMTTQGQEGHGSDATHVRTEKHSDTETQRHARTCASSKRLASVDESCANVVVGSRL